MQPDFRENPLKGVDPKRETHKILAQHHQVLKKEATNRVKVQEVLEYLTQLSFAEWMYALPSIYETLKDSEVETSLKMRIYQLFILRIETHSPEFRAIFEDFHSHEIFRQVLESNPQVFPTFLTNLERLNLPRVPNFVQFNKQVIDRLPPSL